MTFGVWLQDQLDQHGWKQTDLARALHLFDVVLFRTALVLDVSLYGKALVIAHRIN